MEEKKKTMLCWKDNREYAEETYGYGSPIYEDAVNNPSTCLLEEGHKGDHVFTPDSEIRIRFK